jgi:(S)-2-hydroxyglutarate dehydrogenase
MTSVRNKFDYLIVGAGIVGLATAWRLRQKFPQAHIGIVEKETAVGRHQSSHNSGVIHAGVYYPPTSLKAQLCRAGVAATLMFCREHGIAARQCGKLIVATSDAEVGRLRELATRAADNRLQCEWLDAAELGRREAAIVGKAALLVRETGIADYPAVCETLRQLLIDSDAKMILGAAVESIHEASQSVTVTAGRHELETSRLIVCAGLQADRLAHLGGVKHDLVILPFRGDYYRLPATRNTLVRHLIYPVPDPRLPFLGVHLTLTTAGHLTLGPTAMLALARERYWKWAFDSRDALATLSHPGTWRLLARFPRAGALELAHALSRRLYLAAARRYCPQLTLNDLADRDCGVRAQAVNRRGEMLGDFVIEHTARSVHVLNAPSPAATAAFPIADSIVARLER